MGRKEAYNFLKQFVLEQMRLQPAALSDERFAEDDPSALAAHAGQGVSSRTMAGPPWPMRVVVGQGIMRLCPEGSARQV
jgi:hypothetical protein